MHLVVTAGHIDHGKTSLVDCLTGMSADRLPEELARGMSIDLGFVWTELPGGVGTVAFIDVPGHERFIATAIAGIAPGGSAALLAVAADDPWMPQAAEHLQVLDALGYDRAVVAVTRCDLADPGPIRDVLDQVLAPTSLAGAPIVEVSIHDATSIGHLRDALTRVLMSKPAPNVVTDPRMWVDRSFAVKGVGTVVTGTLATGRIGRADCLRSGTNELRVRGIQTLGVELPFVVGPARAALNVVGRGATELRRGSVLFTPDVWLPTDQVDVAVQTDATLMPRNPLLHVGTTMTQVRTRVLGPNAVRVALPTELPLRVGDRVIVRDPGTRRLWGGVVLDPAPVAFHKRGDARRRAGELEKAMRSSAPLWTLELERRRFVRSSFLRQIGVPLPDLEHDDVLLLEDYLTTSQIADEVTASILKLVSKQDALGTSDGLTSKAVASGLNLPSPRIVEALLSRSPDRSVAIVNGHLVAANRRSHLEAAVARVSRALRGSGGDPPAILPLTREVLQEAGLGDAQLDEAVELNVLIWISSESLLTPGALRLASQQLVLLPQPFSVSQARTALGVSRKVAFSILNALERLRVIAREPDDRRSVVLRNLTQFESMTSTRAT